MKTYDFHDKTLYEKNENDEYVLSKVERPRNIINNDVCRLTEAGDKVEIVIKKNNVEIITLAYEMEYPPMKEGDSVVIAATFDAVEGTFAPPIA